MYLNPMYNSKTIYTHYILFVNIKISTMYNPMDRNNKTSFERHVVTTK